MDEDCCDPLTVRPNSAALPAAEPGPGAVTPVTATAGGLPAESASRQPT